MSLLKISLMLVCAGTLAACSPVAEKLMNQGSALPTATGSTVLSTPKETASVVPASARNGFAGGPADLFRDGRARNVGDLVTVRISMNDNANFASTSGGKASTSYQGTGSFSLGLFGVAQNGQTGANTAMDSATSGQGSVTRSEKLNVQVAATVRRILPNGFLLVEGSQETTVNAEQRIVRVSGIVDPRNVALDNSIDYSKIADARISYGGSGAASDAQKPKWGTQLWDKISPF